MPYEDGPSMQTRDASISKPREPSVPRQIDQILKSLQEGAMIGEQLEGRLQPILRSSNPTPQGGAAEAAASRPTLVEQLDLILVSIRQSNSRINSIVNRLEL